MTRFGRWLSRPRPRNDARTFLAAIALGFVIIFVITLVTTSPTPKPQPVCWTIHGQLYKGDAEDLPMYATRQECRP